MKRLLLLLIAAGCGGTKVNYIGHPVPACRAQRPYLPSMTRAPATPAAPPARSPS